MRALSRAVHPAQRWNGMTFDGIDAQDQAGFALHHVDLLDHFVMAVVDAQIEPVTVGVKEKPCFVNGYAERLDVTE